MYRTSSTLLIVSILLVGGCAKEAATPAEAGRPDETAPVVAEAPPPAPAAVVHDTDWNEIQLVKVSFDQWQRELEALRGDIVVVDLWATWCVPCLERFPKMVEMSRQYGPRGVTFVSMSLDDRDDPVTVEEVSTFLTEQDARFPNFLMDEVIPDAFEKLDLLGIPAVFVYDRNGTLRYRLTGDDPNDQFTDHDVEVAIEELLGVV